MDIEKAYQLGYITGAAECLAMDADTRADECILQSLLASDTKEDGFVTLTDKSGKPYVAQFNKGEKERYKETGKKLSQVKTEEKEKQPKKYESEKERINDIIKQLDKKDEEYRKTNTIITKEPSYLDVRKAMESDFVKDYPALSRMFTKGQFEDNRYLAAIVNNNDFADKKELKEYLKENYPGFYKDLQKAEEKEFFRASSPSGKFFGNNGTEKVTGQYFRINHNPDERTVILDDVSDRLRVTGKGDLIFLTDKNKGYYLNDKNSLPVLSYNKDDNTHDLNMVVKFNSNDLRLSMKEYTFKNDFIGTENLKPIKGFADLKKIAAEKDKSEKSYKNVSGNDVIGERIRFADNLKKAESLFRKPAETVSAGGKANDIEQYLKGWNQKIYKYKDGTRAIFSNNKKIVLTEEQYNYLKDKAAN